MTVIDLFRKIQAKTSKPGPRNLSSSKKKRKEKWERKRSDESGGDFHIRQTNAEHEEIPSLLTNTKDFSARQKPLFT